MQHSGRQYGLKHWALQTVPPMLLLLFLYGTDRGTTLIYITGIFALPALVSCVSICFKSLDFRNRKNFLVRPALTVLFFGITILIAQLSYDVALKEATESAEVLRKQCISDHSCPQEPPGWSRDGLRSIRRDVGVGYKYTATYNHDPQDFRIWLARGTDLGHLITGGVETPLHVTQTLHEQNHHR